MNKLDVHQIFSDLGLKKNDIVMIHGDAGVAAQYQDLDAECRLDYLIDEIKGYFFPDGTILVPAFSYSSTKMQDFDVVETPSTVGLFSEHFRKGRDISRSNHPIFSVSAWGKFRADFLQGSNSDCFGAGTFFEKLLQHNVRLIALGCDLNSFTFVHHVEQVKKVKYRYFKNFKGRIIDVDKVVNVDTEYYVRNTNIASNCNLTLLARVAKDRKLLQAGSVGRFSIQTIRAVDLYNVAMELLDENEYSLIDAGIINNEI